VGRAQITGPVADAGATVVEAELGGRRVVTESIGGQVVSKMVTPAPVAMTDPPGALDKDAVTIGRALEAVVAMAGDRPVDQSDAAAIQVAETCATGSTPPSPEAWPRLIRTPAPCATRTRSSSETSSRCARYSLFLSFSRFIRSYSL
jgi:hypothetical protein